MWMIENGCGNDKDRYRYQGDLHHRFMVKKKRKQYKRLSNNPNFMPSLRIFRNDIRRKYADMITNVLNSHDVNLMSQFYYEFSSPDLTHIYSQFPQDLMSNLTHPSKISGIDQVIQSYCLNYQLAPDIVFRFDSVQVVKSTGSSGSRIIAKCNTTGTILYKIPVNRIAGLAECLENPLIMEPAESPVELSIDTDAIFTLDEQHRFVSIEICADKISLNFPKSLQSS